MTTVNISKKVFNDIYIKEDLLHNKDRYLLLFGGAGSGKSVFAVQKILYRMLKETPHRFLVIRKVGATLRNSVFSLFKDIISQWNLTKIFKVNKSDMTITCTLNGNSIIFAGIDDPEKLKSIAGITSIWLEEASELNPQDFRQLDLRLRGKTHSYKQILITFNPISEQNWLKKEFFDREVESCTILKTTYLDNKFIDDDYKKMIEELKEKDEMYYNVYALGNWGVLGNVIFSNYTIKDIPTKASDYPVVYSGVDFGFNDPSAYVRVGIKDNELYIFDELYETKLTNKELIEKLEKKMNKNEWLVCDSAEPDRIKEFRNAHFTKIRAAKKGPGSIKSGIDKIKQHKVYISPSCVNFIKEITNYKYKEDKDGNIYDEPVDFLNHLMDALRYALELKTDKNFNPNNFNKYKLGL